MKPTPSPLFLFIKGFSTGLLLQFALGPIFFFIIHTALQKNTHAALIAVLGVTLADYLYISLALLGSARFLSTLKSKKIFHIIGPGILIFYGILIIINSSSAPPQPPSVFASATSGYFTTFLSGFVLTASSPITIIFWTGLLVSKATEYRLTKPQLWIFGISAGMATLIFLGLVVLLAGSFRSGLTMSYIKLSNLLIGGLLLYYGIVRIWKVRK